VGSLTDESKAEEEVNLEYLRNVVLQFLEHKEMRVRLFVEGKPRILMFGVVFLPAESCEDSDDHSEIHPSGD